MSKLIPKEEISRYRIIPAFVDNSALWKIRLEYAVRLGNEFKGKTTITFETTEGLKTVETTVWSFTDGHIHLKGGTMIPLNSIIDIHF